MKYIIWKSSINEYRVKNTLTGKVSILENFSLQNCKFKVDINKYNEAESVCFKNSGKPDDYFAWIEAEQIIVKLDSPRNNIVFYNPFKSSNFTDRNTGEIVNEASYVVIKGNKLTYTK